MTTYREPWPSAADPLAEALHFLELHGTYHCRADFTAPSGLELPPTATLLIIQFADSGREVRPLPLPFLGPSLRRVVGWDACADRPDGVRRSAQITGGNVSHRTAWPVSAANRTNSRVR